MDEIKGVHWGINAGIATTVAVTAARSTAIAFQFAALRKVLSTRTCPPYHERHHLYKIGKPWLSYAAPVD